MAVFWEDELYITVVATGFNTDGTAKKTTLGSSKTADKKEEAKGVPADDEDDNFYDIMSIFNS